MSYNPVSTAVYTYPSSNATDGGQHNTEVNLSTTLARISNKHSYVVSYDSEVLRSTTDASKYGYNVDERNQPEGRTESDGSVTKGPKPIIGVQFTKNNDVAIPTILKVAPFDSIITGYCCNLVTSLNVPLTQTVTSDTGEVSTKVILENNKQYYVYVQLHFTNFSTNDASSVTDRTKDATTSMPKGELLPDSYDDPQNTKICTCSHFSIEIDEVGSINPDDIESGLILGILTVDNRGGVTAYTSYSINVIHEIQDIYVRIDNKTGDTVNEIYVSLDDYIDQKITNLITKLDDRYLSKIHDDTAQGVITFEAKSAFNSGLVARNGSSIDLYSSESTGPSTRIYPSRVTMKDNNDTATSMLEMNMTDKRFVVGGDTKIAFRPDISKNSTYTLSSDNTGLLTYTNDFTAQKVYHAVWNID